MLTYVPPFLQQLIFIDSPQMATASEALCTSPSLAVIGQGSKPC